MSVPSLQDLLLEKSGDKTPYNKHNFIRYLSSIHCLENYEFINEINKFNKLAKEPNRDKDKLMRWNNIVKNYLLEDSPRELNLPYQIKSNLLKHKMPPADCVKKAYKIIYELLLDSYNQFINVVKKQNMSSYSNHHHHHSNANTAGSNNQSLPIPIQGRRNSSTLNMERRGSTSNSSRRNSMIDFKNSSSSNTRKNSSSSNLPSGSIFSGSYSLTAAISNSNSGGSANGGGISRSGSGTGSRRPSIVADYPRSPINNGTHIKTNITKLPSPSSDVETKKKPSAIPTSNPSSTQNQSLFKMKKFKFRRNSNE